MRHRLSRMVSEFFTNRGWENTMNVNKNRSVLTLFAIAGLTFAVFLSATEAQTHQPSQNYGRSDSSQRASEPHAANEPRSNGRRYSASQPHSTSQPFSTTQPYSQPVIQQPLVRPMKVVPTLSMALPTSGPYQSGLQFSSQTRPFVQPVSFATASLTSTSPFPSLSEQMSRADANVSQAPESYLGTSYRFTGQSLSRLAVRRAVAGTVGLTGVMGLTAAMQ